MCMMKKNFAILLSLISLSFEPHAAAPVMQILTSATTINCAQDNTLTLQSSEIGFNYFLKNKTTNTLVGTAKVGTGNALDFQTGVVSATTSFEVVAAAQNSDSNFDGIDDSATIDVTTELPMWNASRTKSLGLKPMPPQRVFWYITVMQV